MEAKVGRVAQPIRNHLNSRGALSKLRLGGFFAVGLRGKESTASPSTSPPAVRFPAHGPLLFAEGRTHHIT